MTELSREQIEEVRAGGDAMADTLDDLCDIALAKKDAEAECERMRYHLQRILEIQRQNYGDATGLHINMIKPCEEARKALATPPPEGEYRNPLTGYRDQDPAAHPTPEQTGDALAALNREIDTQEMNVVGRNQMGGCMPPSYRAKLRTICESDGAVYLPVEELSELLDAFDELEARHLTASGVLGNCMYCDKPVRLREQAERHFSHATCEQSEREFAEVMEGEKMQPCMGDFMRRIHELGIRDPSEIAKAASGVPEDRVPHKCPSCGSPSPERHPAVQFEGEVMTCHDPWHQHHPGDLGQKTAESALRSLASWLGVGGYNADRVDSATFEAKIREGVETAIRVEKQGASGVLPMNDDDEALEGFQAASGLYNSLMVWLSGDSPQAVSSRESATQMYSTLRRVLRRKSGVPEYQRIETAPEGVRVLLKAGIDNPPVVGTVTHYEEEEGSGDFHSIGRVLHYNGDVLVGAFHATHWRPLDSGVPYVPESVRSLPQELRELAQNFLMVEQPDTAEQLIDMASETERALASAPADGYKEKYHELLYAVARKHPGESRHETALRYIQNAESGGNCQVAAAPTHGGSEHE